MLLLFFECNLISAASGEINRPSAQYVQVIGGRCVCIQGEISRDLTKKQITLKGILITEAWLLFFIS